MQKVVTVYQFIGFTVARGFKENLGAHLFFLIQKLNCM